MPSQNEDEVPLETYKKAMDKALERFHKDKPLAEIKRSFDEEKVPKKQETNIAKTRVKRNNEQGK